MTPENVLFITIDSCRLDTARTATTPNLDRLGPLIACHTTATFTLPAHLSFFSGFLPVPMKPCKFLGEYDRLWRSLAARPTAMSVYQWIETATVLEHYRQAGYRVLGTGGVQFFDPSNSANLLPTMFDIFDYHGIPAGNLVPANLPILTANALEPVIRDALGQPPFFAFANMNETHYPYLSPDCSNDSGTAVALGIMQDAAAVKRYTKVKEPELRRLLAPALKRQREALQWIDRRLGRVMALLMEAAQTTLVVVCSDHGDSFGEGGFIGHGHPGAEVMAVPMWVGRVAA